MHVLVSLSLTKYTKVYPSLTHGLPEFTSVYQSLSQKSTSPPPKSLITGSAEMISPLWMAATREEMAAPLPSPPYYCTALHICSTSPIAPAPSSVSHTLSSLDLPCHLSLYENSLTFPWEYPMIAPWEYSDITLWLLRHYPRFLREPQDYPESFIRIPWEFSKITIRLPRYYALITQRLTPWDYAENIMRIPLEYPKITLCLD